MDGQRRFALVGYGNRLGRASRADLLLREMYRSDRREGYMSGIQQGIFAALGLVSNSHVELLVAIEVGERQSPWELADGIENLRAAERTVAIAGENVHQAMTGVGPDSHQVGYTVAVHVPDSHGLGIEYAVQSRLLKRAVAVAKENADSSSLEFGHCKISL